MNRNDYFRDLPNQKIDELKVKLNDPPKMVHRSTNMGISAGWRYGYYE